MNDINCNKISSEINVEEYLEEACHADADIGESFTNIEPVTIRDGVNNNMNNIICNKINSNDTTNDNEINVEEYFKEACHGDQMWENSLQILSRLQ
ncbi:hypothetical protein F8M41_023031 [Gigaspora margarita]|uniref:Uncharacterized protein n=1 Tax=Gigaspora margarita TaxID=4874 RepID=A0A8H4AE24_GIGMA|nr:hypothetical protein F8M41_023031 [Gigaspora margarita]